MMLVCMNGMGHHGLVDSLVPEQILMKSELKYKHFHSRKTALEDTV